MNPTDVKQNLDKLRRSYSRISKKSTFYDEFCESLIQNVEVSKHFEGVSKARRSFFLKTLLPTLVINAMGSHVAEKRMRRLAKKHARDQMNVDSDLYEFWHDTLTTVLRKYDDEFDEELEELWSNAIRKGIKTFIDAY